jgi:glycine hydroxymethyltransferase
MDDYLVRESLREIDPAVEKIISLEHERQLRKLILIPSESSAPISIRQCLGSVFQNLYAEGYPDEETRWMDEDELLDLTTRLNHYRRYSDPRYYKGVEFADVIESLARRRCALLFETSMVKADDLFVNVQPLSGAPANNAVYHALIEPGEKIMGMNLFHGGHLTHGSSVNRSGKLYEVVHYNVNPITEQIDYDELAARVQESKPRIIIAGYSSYPWVPDWKKFRQIADSVGAYVLADVSHIAGLIAAQVIPSPVGYADVITFTTHKTLCGPRGACILTNQGNLAQKIDRAVFPGEQGGPHVNVFAALAVTFKIAKSSKFRQLQKQIVNNCQVLTKQLLERGLRIAYGGTNTHLTNIDCKTIKNEYGTSLSGDMAARILDIVGLVTNPNTIPGDKSTLKASGVRLGTPWVTQRGFKEQDMVKIADVIADVLQACKPFELSTRTGTSIHAKVDFKVLEDSKIKVRKLVDKTIDEKEIEKHRYPYFSFMDDKPQKATTEGYTTLELRGNNIRQFINFTFASDCEVLNASQKQNTTLITSRESIQGQLICINPYTFHFKVSSSDFNIAAAWLRDLSDGYISFDDDLLRKIPGPISVIEVEPENSKLSEKNGNIINKPFYIGISKAVGEKLAEFNFQPPMSDKLKRTALFDIHQRLNAKMAPFAGWEMPLWYSSVVDEHQAVRNSAGLFDVSHMGVYQVEGPDGSVFLDCVCANDISALDVGESCYTHFLDPHARVIDDLLIYHHKKEEFLVVVNAANDDKDWAWLNSVLHGDSLVDLKTPWSRAYGRNAILRNLRDPKEGVNMKVDIALQGPKSKDILLSLPWTDEEVKRINSLKRTELCHANLHEVDVILSRTGYTGEKVAYEIFIHPNETPWLWNKLLEVGNSFGLKPCGLGARDSLRTEAGLPLYGHEMGGELNLGVGDAGFASYVKSYKPWFIGRDSFLEQEKHRQSMVVRFRFNSPHVRMAHLHDPIMDETGKVIGTVTSCAIDQQGYLTGQAYIDLKYAVESQPIYIYQNAKQQKEINVSSLKIGERTVLPTSAMVISRFLK